MSAPMVTPGTVPESAPTPGPAAGAGIASALAAVSATQAARQAEAHPLVVDFVEELAAALGARLTLHQRDTLAGALGAAIDARTSR